MRKLFLVSLALAACAAASAQQTVTVSNMDQFLRAIRPDRTIVMRPGTYEVKKGAAVQSPHFRWDDAGEGAAQLTLVDLPRLTIKAQAPGVRIVAPSPWVWVLRFEGCGEIVLEGLTIGHETTEACMAGVLHFNVAEDVALDSCDLYGSGSVGLETFGVTRVSLNNTTIRDCTSHAGSFRTSEQIAFDGCTITGNGAFALFQLDGVDAVAFRGTEISGNAGQAVFNPTGRLETRIEFVGCTLERNEVELLAGAAVNVAFEDCSLTANGFGDDPAAMAGLVAEDAGPVETRAAVFEPAGLSLAVPAGWETATVEDGKALQIVDRQQASLTVVHLSQIFEAQPGSGAPEDPRRFLEDAFVAFRDAQQRGNALERMQMVGDLLDIDGSPAADFVGFADSQAYFWSRVILVNGKVWMIFSFTNRSDHPALRALMESVAPVR